MNEYVLHKHDQILSTHF